LKWDEASKVYFTFFNKPSPKSSQDQIFFARKQYGFDLEKQNKTKDAEKHWDATLKLYNANRAQLAPESTAHEVAAQIMYRRAMPAVDQYMAMAVTGPKTKVAKKQEDDILKKQLFEKADHLQKVEKDFVTIIDTGAGEWGLASLIVLGKAYENMGETLKNSAAPSYLNPDQQNMYRMAMEDRVFPQVEKAVEAYSTALKKSFDLSLYNDNTAYATRRLGELRPDDFPELLEKVPNPKYTSSDSIELPLETSL
jgi:cellulose synthase operon protein C